MNIHTLAWGERRGDGGGAGGNGKGSNFHGK